MPPGQVSRGQRDTGLRLLGRSWFSKRSSSSSSKSGSGSDDASNSGNSANPNGSSGSPNGSNGSGGGDSSSHSSSALPKPSGIPPLPPPCIGPCVPDNNPRVIYSSDWSIQSEGFFGTSHQTEQVGSWLYFNFTGSAITVFGSIPISNTTHGPPTAAYSIDAAKPFVTVQPLANQLLMNQPLFSASNLSGDTMHSLVVNVTAVHSVSPFSVDYFFVTPSPPPSASASAIAPEVSLAFTTQTSDAKSHSTQATVGLIAGVLGAVIIVLLVLFAFLVITFRRRRRRALRSQSVQDSSLFTTTESILMWSRAPSSHPSSWNPTMSKSPLKTVTSEK
ncbi:hypothetical protein B0H11DRAFT_2213459 [Mycena galericulata]|nr:hypothetical protein B0H11DRAFT_2213459 [Mycena galericulata]